MVSKDKLKEELNEVDIRFSSQGYKTVAQLRLAC